MPAVAPTPSASDTMAMAVTKGVLKSVRMANLRLRIRALDGPRYRGVYRLGRNALGFATSGCSHEKTGAGTVLHRQPGELLELSCAVAQFLRRHAEEVEHRELQVRQ